MTLFHLPLIVPVLVFLAVLTLLWAVHDKRTADPLLERIRSSNRAGLRDRMALVGRDMATKYPGLKRYISYSSVENRLKTAGFPLNMTAEEFVGVKLVFIGLAVVAFLVSVVSSRLFVLMFLGVAFLPDLILDALIRRRKRRIDKEFVMVAGRMAAAARAGMSLPQALRWVANKMGSALSDELRWCVRNLDAQIPVTASLDSLASRTGLVNVRRMASALINAERYHTPVAEALITAAADARRRRLDALTARIEDVSSYAVVFLVLMVIPEGLLALAPMWLGAQRTGFFF